jgi:hypothetical protein
MPLLRFERGRKRGEQESEREKERALSSVL